MQLTRPELRAPGFELLLPGNELGALIPGSARQFGLAME